LNVIVDLVPLNILW